MSAPEPTAAEVAAFNREEGTATPPPVPVDAAERVRAYLRTLKGWAACARIAQDCALGYALTRDTLLAMAEAEPFDKGAPDGLWRLRAQPTPPPVATAPAVDTWAALPFAIRDAALRDTQARAHMFRNRAADEHASADALKVASLAAAARDKGDRYEALADALEALAAKGTPTLSRAEATALVEVVRGLGHVTMSAEQVAALVAHVLLAAPLDAHLEVERLIVAAKAIRVREAADLARYEALAAKGAL